MTQCRAILAAVAIFAVLSCGGDAAAPEKEPDNSPKTIVPISNGQSAAAGAALPEPIGIRVLDAAGRAVASAAVTWTATDGTISGAATTGPTGEATADWTLAPKLGAQSATARVGSLPAVTLQATATLPADLVLAKLAGDVQTDTLGQKLPDSLAVEVRLAAGPALSGATVEWEVTGGGSVSAGAVTDTDGRTRAAWTLGAALGPQTATARVGTTAAATFTAEALMSNAAVTNKVAGDAQSDTVGRLLQDSLAVEVRLATGQPLTGATVAWTTDDGSVSGTAVTDAAGRAVAAWTLGTVAGPQSVTAAVEGLDAVTFSATAVPGAPTELVLDPDSLVVGRDPGADTASYAVSARDGHGNAIESAGLTVAWASSDTAVARVDGNGRITGRTAGTATITASAGALQVQSRAVVRLQMNAQCVVPTGFPARPAAGGLPAFDLEMTAIQALYTIIMAVTLDADGDGDDDVVMLSSDDPITTRQTGQYRGTTVVWRNDGGGTFTDATAQLLGGIEIKADYPRHFEVADFNGDGRMDVFVGQHGDESELNPADFPGAANLLLIAQPDGTLRDEASTRLNPYETGSYTHGAAAGDVTCNGAPDIFESDWFLSDDVNLQINLGGGTFENGTSRLPDEVRMVNWPWRNWGSASFCDIDRDGDNDMLLGAAGGGYPSDRRNWLLLNNGFGEFRSAQDGALPEPHFGRGNNEAVEIRCADFDLDGWNDVVISSTTMTPYYGTPHVALLLNNRDGTLRDATASQLPQSWTSGFARRVFVADLNSDGWPDIVASGSDMFPRYFINRGDAQFTEHVLTEALNFGLRWYSLTGLHADGDGRLDLLLTASSNGQSFLLRQR